MAIQIVDIEQETEEVQTGTCELCFGSTNMNFTTYILKDNGGKVHTICGTVCEWGDWYEEYPVDNVFKFMEFANDWFKLADVNDFEDIDKVFGRMYESYIQG